MTLPIVYVLRAGRTDYIRSLELQMKIAQQNSRLEHKKFKNVLILTEHNPVYTVGIRTKDYKDGDEKRLRELGADFQRTNRGGLITFHGPGQLIAYPILHLKNFHPSVRWYVCHIEKTIISLCEKYGISAQTTQDTGVWVGNNKICAIGIHVSRYITTHGLAFNCDTNLEWFDHIVPCGIVGKGVTTLSQELGKPINIDSVVPRFLNSFSDILNCKLIEIEKNELKSIL